MTLDALSSHVANIAGWTASTFDGDELDVQPTGPNPIGEPEAKSTPNCWNVRQERCFGARRAGSRYRRELAGKVVFEDDRQDILYTAAHGGDPRFHLSHLIHHRAQLGVYLRLLDIPVPAIHGPSADEDS